MRVSKSCFRCSSGDRRELHFSWYVPDGKVRVSEVASAEGHGVVDLSEVAFAEVLLLIVAVVGDENAFEVLADRPTWGGHGFRSFGRSVICARGANAVVRKGEEKYKTT